MQFDFHENLINYHDDLQHKIKLVNTCNVGFIII